MRREVARANRRLADQTSQRLRGIPDEPWFFATVSATSPLTVTWRGGALPVRSRGAGYTPALNDRVLCVLVHNQVVVVDRMI